MNGAQIKASDNRQARSMMRLHRKEYDVSKRKPGLKAFSERGVPLLGGASLVARRLVRIASASQYQWAALRTCTCALTSGSSGSTNSPLRSAFVAH